jgi:hypothetical protein
LVVKSILVLATLPEYWDNGTIPWMSSGEVNLETVHKTEKYITESGLKTYNFRIKLRMCKRPIEYCLNTKSSHNRQQTNIEMLKIFWGIKCYFH